MKKRKKDTSSGSGLLNSNITKAISSGTGEALLGALAGSGVAAFTGKNSLLAGTILSIAGNYFGGKMEILKIIGASTIAYGIAKSSQYKADQNSTVSKRMDELTDDWFGGFRKQWEQESQPTSNTTITRVSPESSEKEQKKTTSNEQTLKGKNSSKSKDAAPSKPEKKSSNESEKVEKPEKIQEPVQKNSEDTIKQKIQQAIILTIESDEDTEDALKKVGLTEEEVEQFLEKKAQEKGIDQEQILYEITSEIKNYKEAMEYGNSDNEPPKTDSIKQLSRAERRKLQRNQEKVDG